MDGVCAYTGNIKLKSVLILVLLKLMAALLWQPIHEASF